MKLRGNMAKILGKICGLLFLMFSASIQAYINLEVNSFSGRKITEVAAGESFVLKVTTDEVDHVQELTIEGIEHIAAQKTGLSLITINGNKTAQITYQVHVDKPGNYRFGPAYIPGGTTRSGIVSVRVHAERVTDNHAKAIKNENGNALLRLDIDHDNVFVGQKINTRLRAYFPASENITIDQVISNDPEAIVTTEKRSPIKGTESINGTTYNFLEWRWEMYPKEPGSLVIPAYFIDYAKEIPQQQGFASLAVFFGPRYERKRAYSNALTLQVKPLPDPQQPIDAVGHFVSYRADIKPAVAKIYEGAVLTLTVEGDGNMDAIHEPVLEGIPDAFKYYFSKSFISQGAIGLQKSFEYILQGLQEGERQIPAQHFTFFDVESEQYKTLQTEPLSVNILSDHAALPDITSSEKEVQHEQQQAQDLEIAFNKTDRFLPMDYALSFGQLFFLMIFPLLSIGLYHLFRSEELLALFAPSYRKKRIFNAAYKELSQAYKHHNIAALHAVFLHLFKRLKLEFSDDLSDRIAEKASWPDTKKTSWHQFYDRITQAAYAGNTQSKDIIRLFHEAEQWLHELEGIIS